MFALDLYRHVARPASNCFLSPYSIAAALGMVGAGAVGQTRDDFGHVLGVRDPLATFAALGRELAKRAEPSRRERRALPRQPTDTDELGCRLTIANALWHQRGYPIHTYAGIGVYRPQLLHDWRAIVGDLPDADATPPRFPLAPLLFAAALRGELSGQVHAGAWTDVGTPERLDALRNALALP